MEFDSKAMQWLEAYRIGLPEIDEQHKTLVDLFNDLRSAIAANAPVQESAGILERLQHYVINHFIAEETTMQARRYANFETHQRAHRSFVERLQAERVRQQNGEPMDPDILRCLQDWLLEHIQVDDKAYADHCAGRNKPVGFLGRFFSRFRAARA